MSDINDPNLSYAASPFDIKRGDLLPSLAAVLLNNDGSVVDLSSATGVKLYACLKGSLVETIAGVAAVIVSAVAGSVRYDFTGTDTAIAGEYMAEWRVTWTGGKTSSYPGNGYDRFFVVPKL